MEITAHPPLQNAIYGPFHHLLAACLWKGTRSTGKECEEGSSEAGEGQIQRRPVSQKESRREYLDILHNFVPSTELSWALIQTPTLDYKFLEAGSSLSW